MNIFCGIDFGTTNTVVSISGKDGELIDSFSVPTILFIPEENQGISHVYIGEEAKTAYEAGKKGRYIHSIKRSLSDRYLRHTTINRTYVKLERLVSLFLEELKKKVRERWGIEPVNIALGRPVKFSTDEESNRLANERLLESFRMAGFSRILQLEEPVAASFCFEDSFSDNDSSFLIMDLGGGTSDFSLMTRSPMKQGMERYSVKSIDGINIGGDNFDEDLMFDVLSPLMGINATFESFNKRLPMPVHLYREVCRWNAMHLIDRKTLKEDFSDYLYRSDDPVAIHRLRTVIENRLTHQLLEESRNCKHSISDMGTGRIIYNHLELGIDCSVKENQFEKIIEPSIDILRNTVAKMAGPEGLSSISDKVIITGGSSRIPGIGKAAAELVGEESILMDGNFYNSVSKGLSMYAYYNNLAIID